MSCACDWTWINEKEIKENDYYLMATKECNHNADIMLYQYLYDICNSTITYDFITTVDVMFPTPAPPVPVPCEPVACIPVFVPCEPVACTPVPCTPSNPYNYR